MKKRDKSKLALHRDTLHLLYRGDLPRVHAGISLASVCQENTQPECGVTTIWTEPQ